MDSKKQRHHFQNCANSKSDEIKRLFEQFYIRRYKRARNWWIIEENKARRIRGEQNLMTKLNYLKYLNYGI